jgi:hypothetical protein
MAPRGADATERSLGIKTSPIFSKPVVAKVADPTLYVRGNATNTQEMRRADAADAALNKQRGYVQMVPSAAQAEAEALVALAAPNAFTNAFGNMGSGGSGAPAGPKYSDRTDRMKVEESTRQFDITNALDQAQFDFSKATTAQGRADAKAKFDALKNYYDTGGYKTGFDELNNIAVGQYNTGVQGLQGTYDRAQENLGAGYDMAQGLTDQGYTALQNYLQQNPSNAYAGLQQQVQTVANPMQQFLSAYGVSGEPVQAQVAAEQLAGQQGAGAFNSLADILNRTAQQSDASRMAEMQMGRTMANSGLGAQRANYQAQNAQAQAQALAQLQQQLSGQQFGIQQNQMQAGQDIYNQLLAATGNYGQPSGGEGIDTGMPPNFSRMPDNGANSNPGLTPDMLQALLARRGM